MDGGRKRSVLLVVPTNSTSVVTIGSRKMCWALIRREQLYDIIAGVGRAVDVDDVVGKFGEDTCNASITCVLPKHTLRAEVSGFVQEHSR